MERRINPILNNHKSYKTMNLINPYAYKSDVRVGLIVDLPMNEGSGLTVYDKAGSNNCTINGATWVGNILGFDGVNDTVNKPSAINTGQNFTISCWVNLVQKNRNSICRSGYNYQADKGWLIAVENTKKILLSIGADNVWGYSTNGIPAWGVWCHIVITVTNGGETIAFYINAVGDGSKTSPSRTITYAVDIFEIGKYGADYGQGNIQNMRLYNRVLSQLEITQLYNFQKA